MYFLRKIAFVAFLTPFAFIQADVEEVIVTANKKVETVQEIPMNISVSYTHLTLPTSNDV